MRPLTAEALASGEVRFEDVRPGLPPLVPVVAQDVATGAVLMVAWADAAALQRSLESGEMHYHSRSRNVLWKKGETSGHTQYVDGLFLDCDGDTILARVRQDGPACHTGAPTCFDSPAPEAMPVGDVLSALAALVRARRHAPHAGSYTNRLLDDTNLRLKKVGEESGEFLVAAARDDKPAMAEEAADLLYHLVVALEGGGVPLDEVLGVLLSRRR